MLSRTAVTKSHAVIVIVIIIVAIVAGAYAYVSMTTVPTAQVSSTMVPTSAAMVNATIVVDTPAVADTLDPAVAWHAQAYDPVQQVYQGLVSYAPNSSQIVPFLAQNFSVSPDGLSYAFSLRKNVVFSNGDPVNAYEFWYTLYRCAVMNQGPAYYLTVDLNMSGVTPAMLNEYNTTNDIPPPSLLSMMENPNLAVTVTGQYSLEFHLALTFAPFLATLTQPEGSVVDPLVVSEHGGVQANAPDPWMLANAVGTGPFLETSYEPNTEVTLERNPTYWGGANGIQMGIPKLSKVIYEQVPNSLTSLENVERGSAQLAYVDFTLAAQLHNATGVYVPELGAMLSTHWLEFNTAKFPFNIPLIREAFVHAINETALDTFYGGYAEPFAGPVPRGVAGYNYSLPSSYTYNLTLAKQLLAEAGYPGGKGIPPLELRFSTDRTPEPYVVPLIASELSNLGITVNLVGTTIAEFDTFLSSTKPTDPSYPELMYTTWFWFPDPWAFADWFVGPIGTPDPNWGIYNNTMVNTLLAKADRTVNPQQRDLLYEQVDEIVYNDAPCMWVAQFRDAYPEGLVVASTSLQGFARNLQFGEVDVSTLYMVS